MEPLDCYAAKRRAFQTVVDDAKAADPETMNALLIPQSMVAARGPFVGGTM
jgi:hypothetical protein